MRLLFGIKFRSEFLEHTSQHGDCPLLFVQSFGSFRIDRLEGILRFTEIEIERQQLPKTASFLGTIFVPFVDQKAFAGCEQKCSKPPAVLIGSGNGLFLQQLLKKRLCEILGLMHIANTPSNVGVQWVPVRLTQFGQSVWRRGLITFPGSEDQARACCCKRGILSKGFSVLVAGIHTRLPHHSFL